jgi:hypothetical protein
MFEIPEPGTFAENLPIVYDAPADLKAVAEQPAGQQQDALHGL